MSKANFDNRKTLPKTNKKDKISPISQLISVFINLHFLRFELNFV